MSHRAIVTPERLESRTLLTINVNVAATIVGGLQDDRIISRGNSPDWIEGGDGHDSAEHDRTIDSLLGVQNTVEG